MNGPQDLGGQMGFGPIAPEIDEPVFHANWERRAMALVLAAGGMGHWSIDESRQSRERLRPADYYGSSYYEIWIKAVENLLREKGFVTTADLAAGHPVDPAPVPRPVLDTKGVDALIKRGTPYDRPVTDPPRFALGDRVHTLNLHPETHTRLPRYARDKAGLVVGVYGGFVFPDSNAVRRGEAPQHLYTIAFAATELWGPGADPTLEVSIDAWESYLEPA